MAPRTARDPLARRAVARACFLLCSNVHPVGLNATTVSNLAR